MVGVRSRTETQQFMGGLAASAANGVFCAASVCRPVGQGGEPTPRRKPSFGGARSICYEKHDTPR